MLPVKGGTESDTGRWRWRRRSRKEGPWQFSFRGGEQHGYAVDPQLWRLACIFVHPFLKLAYTDFLKYMKAPSPSCEAEGICEDAGPALFGLVTLPPQTLFPQCLWS